MILSSSFYFRPLSVCIDDVEWVKIHPKFLAMIANSKVRSDFCRLPSSTDISDSLHPEQLMPKYVEFYAPTRWSLLPQNAPIMCLITINH